MDSLYEEDKGICEKLRIEEEASSIITSTPVEGGSSGGSGSGRMLSVFQTMLKNSLISQDDFKHAEEGIRMKYRPIFFAI